MTMTADRIRAAWLLIDALHQSTGPDELAERVRLMGGGQQAVTPAEVKAVLDMPYGEVLKASLTAAPRRARPL